MFTRLVSIERSTEIIIIYTVAASDFIAHIWLNEPKRRAKEGGRMSSRERSSLWAEIRAFSIIPATFPPSKPTQELLIGVIKKLLGLLEKYLYATSK